MSETILATLNGLEQEWRSMNREIGELRADVKRIPEMVNETAELNRRVSKLELQMGVLASEFAGVKKVVYGAVGVTLVTVLGAVLALVLRG